MINKERILSEFFELVKINCPSRDEREVADVLKERLTKLNLSVKEDDIGGKIGGNCGNVFAYLKGNVPGAPTVMLNAHMDCVQPCAGIEPILKNGVISSAGDTILGADNKAGVVAIMEAIRVVQELNIPHGDVQVIFTVAEDGGLDGARNMDKANLQADFGYSFDASGSPGEIITMAPGQNSILVTMYGKSAHAGVAPEEGINAIAVAGKALAELQQGRIDFETTANVGIILGGVATNIVPDRVELKCEARSRNLDKLEAQSKHMKETFERVAAANGARAEVTVEKAYNPYVLGDNDPVIKLFAEAAESIGIKANLAVTGGGSDANFFNAYGLPTAVLGIGMSKVHTADEFIKEVDLYQSAEVALAIIKSAASMKK
jgi:tripeptide aminopeptidase